MRGDVAERRTWRIAEELGQGAGTVLLDNVSAPQVERARGLGVEIGPAIEIGWTASHARASGRIVGSTPPPSWS